MRKGVITIFKKIFVQFREAANYRNQIGSTGFRIQNKEHRIQNSEGSFLFTTSYLLIYRVIENRKK